MDQPGALTAAVGEFIATELPGVTEVCVGLSGGADSLALTAATRRAGLAVHALVVDHRLQDGSAEVAARAAQAARSLGATAEVLTVTVGTAGGPEAAARDARYAALTAFRAGRPVLLGHTLDDQAETMLLGLGRGSGARSIAGMSRWSAPWGRPLLGVRRSATRAACTAWGLDPWEDPHNADPRYTRVRLRTEVLPLLEEVLGGGVAQALARTADALRADTDLLDEQAAELAAGYVRVAPSPRTHRAPTGRYPHVTVSLAAEPEALRRRVLRRWLLVVGATEPTARVVAAVDALLVSWRGQGPVAVGGDPQHRLVVARRGEHLVVESHPR